MDYPAKTPSSSSAQTQAKRTSEEVLELVKLLEDFQALTGHNKQCIDMYGHKFGGDGRLYYHDGFNWQRFTGYYCGEDFVEGVRYDREKELNERKRVEREKREEDERIAREAEEHQKSIIGYFLAR